MSVDIIEDNEDIEYFNSYFTKAQRVQQVELPDNGWDVVDLYCKLYADHEAVGGDHIRAMYRRQYAEFMDGALDSDIFYFFVYKGTGFREESGIARFRNGIPMAYWGMTRSFC